MRIDGIKLTINFTTIKDLLFKKKKRKVVVGEVIELFGYKYRIYDVGDDEFKAYKEPDN